VRFALLGPLRVMTEPGGSPAGPAQHAAMPPRLRVLLAALLLGANSPVPVGELAELVWDGSPPAGAPGTLRAYVMRLRRAVGSALAGRIVTRNPGYLIELEDHELDVRAFEELCGRARAAASLCSWPRCSALASQALALWLGAPLADIPSQALHDSWVPRLEELRLQVLGDRIDSDLHLGRYDQLVPELRDLTRQHPFREHLHAQLMSALAHAGRRAEALAAFQQARLVLVDELGVEPGSELQEWHREILSGAPLLSLEPAGQATDRHRGKPADGDLAADRDEPADRDQPAQPDPAAVHPMLPRRVVPRMLPAAVRQFVGREAELQAMSALAGTAWSGTAASGAAGYGTGFVPVALIAGPPGVGKTALAVRWAHQAAGEFPDGQLYANLRGYAAAAPVRAADALAAFLRALGVPGQEIPADTDERIGRYRSLLAGRRILVVLDNASSAEQARPLLPGTAGAMAIVTSRDTLAGLVARDGAERLDLGLLPLAEAVGLLRVLIGRRPEAELTAAAGLAEQCGRLPLALRVAAELAVARPQAPLAELAAELADQRLRLSLLDAGGDDQTSVRTVFSFSYRRLTAVAARAFRLASLHPGPDFDQYAVAALTGTDAAQAGQALAELARAHLVEAEGGRYALHDLLRGYAAELAARQDQDRAAARARLGEFCLQAAAAAMSMLFPAERGRLPADLGPARVIPLLPDPAAARVWLDAERAALVAVAAASADGDLPGHATRLAGTLFRYLDTGGHFPEAVTVHRHACAAARRLHDPAAEADAMISLGGVDLQQGRYQRAARQFRPALGLARRAGSRGAEIRALGNLGLAEFHQGWYLRAGDYFEQVLAGCRQAGDRAAEAHALGCLGDVELRLGRYRQAADYLERALAGCQQAGDRIGKAHLLTSLGEVDLRQGRVQQAGHYLRQSVAACQRNGDRTGEGYAQVGLGDGELALGRPTAAQRHYDRALALFRETGHQTGQAMVLNSLGTEALAAGRPAEARDLYAAALGLASQTGDQHQQARARDGLGSVHHAIGDTEHAREHWRRALKYYERAGVPEADPLRARLGAVTAK
jgi:DNA-binding SARP family transcriptional activator/Tfp pilus assembly protein PilF